MSTPPATLKTSRKSTGTWPCFTVATSETLRHAIPVIAPQSGEFLPKEPRGMELPIPPTEFRVIPIGTIAGAESTIGRATIPPNAGGVFPAVKTT